VGNSIASFNLVKLMKILLSIKPEFADKIFNGSKRFEFRKNIFKNKSVRTVVVYVTRPVGKIVGEFDINEIINDEPKVLWKRTHEFAGITKDFFDAYFRAGLFSSAVQTPGIAQSES
jgi:predicted transcriptional regulator